MVVREPAPDYRLREPILVNAILVDGKAEVICAVVTQAEK